MEVQELRKQLEADPQSFDASPLATIMTEQADQRPAIRELCFVGLQQNPHNALLRLLLARCYYLDGLGEFAVRELVELQKYSQAPSLERLLNAFGNYARPFLQSGKAASEQTSEGEEAVVAEIDIDAEFTDAFEDLKE